MTDEIEDRLKEALSRVEAPEGFAERVIARAEATTKVHETYTKNHEVVVRFRPRRVWWAAAAAAILALVPTVYLTIPTGEPEETRIIGPTSEDVPLLPQGVVSEPPNPLVPYQPLVVPAPAARPTPHAVKRQQKHDRDAELYAEALEVKQQLVRALAITGNAMERVQRTVDVEPEKIPTSVRKNKRSDSRS